MYKLKSKEIQSKVISYQKNWDRYEKLINERFSTIFEFDTNVVFNDLVCNITLNPISPRYLEQHVFDVFYMNSDEGSLGSSLHELVHYLWFYLYTCRVCRVASTKVTCISGFLNIIFYLKVKICFLIQLCMGDFFIRGV